MARILVVEDNAANLELMVYLLQASGHAIATAQDGVEGLAAARRAEHDLVICDVHLPAMDGYALAQHLRGDAARRRIPLVAVTAMAMVGDRDKVLAAGFDGYISKPIDPYAFVAQVEAFLAAGTAGMSGARRAPDAGARGS